VIVVGQKVQAREGPPLQFDLLEPISSHYRYKSIVTNRGEAAATLVAFHESRSDQEALIGELKRDCGIDVIPAKRFRPNQIHLLASLIAHNIDPDLQIATDPRHARTTSHRSALSFCQELSTLRRQLLWQPERLIRTNGKLTLSLTNNEQVKMPFLSFWSALTGGQNAAA